MGVNKLPNKFNVYVYVYDKSVKGRKRKARETRDNGQTHKFNL